MSKLLSTLLLGLLALPASAQSPFFQEPSEAPQESREELSNNKLKRLFGAFDRNKDGKLDGQERKLIQRIRDAREARGVRGLSEKAKGETRDRAAKSSPGKRKSAAQGTRRGEGQARRGQARSSRSQRFFQQRDSRRDGFRKEGRRGASKARSKARSKAHSKGQCNKGAQGKRRKAGARRQAGSQSRRGR